MAVPWVRFTENALVPKIMLQFQNGDTSWHQGDSAGIFMYSAGIFETFVKKILCPRASPMCTGQYTVQHDCTGWLYWELFHQGWGQTYPLLLHVYIIVCDVHNS